MLSIILTKHMRQSDKETAKHFKWHCMYQEGFSVYFSKIRKFQERSSSMDLISVTQLLTPSVRTTL